MKNSFVQVTIIVVLLFMIAGCQSDEPTDSILTAIPTPPGSMEVAVPENGTEVFPDDIDFVTVAMDAPNRLPEFGDIDPFGNVIGFEPATMRVIADILGLDVEFVVTGYAGMLDSVANGEFNAAMSSLIIPEQPRDGLAFTHPYLETGQVLMVLANNNSVASYRDLGLGNVIGVQQYSSAEQTARGILGFHEPDLQLFEIVLPAIQALIDGQVDGVILDNEDAEYFTATYPQQLKIAGGQGPNAWISSKAYGIAVPEGNTILLEMFNKAINEARANGSIDLLKQEWLVAQGLINAGESLVGTLPDELVIGMVGELTTLDPGARNQDLIGWEIRQNTMAGLLRYDTDNNLVPLLALEFPQISDDRLEYTFSLRPDLTFPDGSELTANDVRFSIIRAAGLGNFQVNRYLKDDNGDRFADFDAIQVIDEQTIKIVLAEPTSFFLSVLATPPFSIISETCYTVEPEPIIACGGFGPYRVSEWEPGSQLRMEANPSWPGNPVAFEKIQIRFFETSARMRQSLENNAIDIAGTGMSADDWRSLRSNAAYASWEGPPTFKSYLVFEQSNAPWSSARLREAVALAVDREALVENIFQGSRLPLYSPVPDGTPGHIATEPTRDLNTARSILTASGYGPSNRLEMTIWFIDDGRYTPLEEAYANAIKDQLEETGAITVTVEGAPWEVFRPQSIECNYSAYLLGWPSIDEPTDYLDAMSWLEYFVTETESICSNYDSPAMASVYEQALEEVDENQRLDLYRQMQEIWAREFPTLDLTQEPRVLISMPKVQNVAMDAMGLLHYELLYKAE